MRTKVLLIERKPSGSVSIERVFRQIAQHLPQTEFDVEFQSVPYGNGIRAILGNLLLFRPRRADIYHVTGDIHYITMRLPRSRTILTIHDLVFLRQRSGLRRLVLKKLFLDVPLARSAVVTAVSAATRAEILEKADSLAEVTVIDDPVIDGFVKEPARPFGTGRPVILHVGTAANKNLARLFEAVQGMAWTLVVVGRMSEDQCRAASAYRIDLINKPHLNGTEIVEEYRNCDIVSYCSTYEGFGLPILEAQAMGKPVVTSDLAPMNWVAGDAAILVDPESAESIRDGLVRAIGDPSLRQELLKRGEANVKRFGADRIAAEYAEVYRSVAVTAGDQQK